MGGTIVFPDDERYRIIWQAWSNAGKPRHKFETSNGTFVANQDNEVIRFIEVRPATPIGSQYNQSSYKKMSDGR